MRDKPLVSIVTPSYNQGRFIEDTILSVKNQDYPNIEHIIVDGGSTDNTLDILKKYEGTYNMRWISEPDEGQSDAVNKGFRMAKGEIIGWLNSDDVYFTRDVISYVVEEFKKHPNLSVVYGDVVFIDKTNTIFKVIKMYEWNYNRLLRGLSISQPATFFHRQIICENKLDDNLHYAMDFEFWLRLGKKYKFIHVNKILAGNRIHKERKRISRGDVAKNEDILIMKRYGQKLDIKFYALRYLIDYPFLQIKRICGVFDMLRLNKINNLAFNAKFPSTFDSFYNQILPTYWLKYVKN